MTAILRRLPSGARVLIHPCDECGSDHAPWGYCLPGKLSRWYCREHREIGEAYLRGEA